ncbi:MAG TPA: hypothetical protein VEB65_05070 [Solirubrobacterales bacterium]|nr:hypothetical protein [Solirubrobacterales bacterium]
MSAKTWTYRLGSGARRSPDGRLIVGGWPPRCVRLTAAGAEVLDAALAGQPTAGAGALVRRLVAYGMLDPLAARSDARLTFVVPMRDGGPVVAALVAELLAYGPVIVVDDGSSDGSPDLARASRRGGGRERLRRRAGRCPQYRLANRQRRFRRLHRRRLPGGRRVCAATGGAARRGTLPGARRATNPQHR